MRVRTVMCSLIVSLSVGGCGSGTSTPNTDTDVLTIGELEEVALGSDDLFVDAAASRPASEQANLPEPIVAAALEATLPLKPTPVYVVEIRPEPETTQGPEATPEPSAALATDTNSATDPDQSNSQGGIVVNNSDWVITGSSNITFGDHSADAGFVPVSSNDTDSVKVLLKDNSHYGSASYILFPDNVEEVWISYCMRIASNWTTSVGGKLPGFAGDSSPTNGGQGGAPANGNNAWSARMLYGSFDNQTNSVPLGHYIYHTSQSYVSQFGDPEWWAPEPSRLFSLAARAPHNTWVAIKQHIKVNSSGADNGIIEAWFNHDLVYSRSDFKFTDREEFREIHKFWLDIYHGGSAKAPSDHHIYFDKFNYSIGSDTTYVSCT